MGLVSAPQDARQFIFVNYSGRKAAISIHYDIRLGLGFGTSVQMYSSCGSGLHNSQHNAGGDAHFIIQND